MKRNVQILVLALLGGCMATTDIDGDGVEDGSDACPNTVAGEPIDARGCSTLDDDRDGVFNDMDACDNTPPGDIVDSRGCEPADTDGDGIDDEADTCPGTAPGESVNGAGCSILDDDGDGVLNDMDRCDDTPAGTVVNSRGCEPVDTDGDGVDDEEDTCPGTAAGDSVDAAGCSTLDDDGDGVLNDMDQCVSQPGDLVDGTGCLVEELVGTLSGEWLINGLGATRASCAAAGIAEVRFNVDAADGSDSGSWTFPCDQALFDSRTASDEPTIVFNVEYDSFWEALGPGGAVVAMTTPLFLQLDNPPFHAVVATPDFVTGNQLTVPLAWETDLSSGQFRSCDVAMVDRSIDIEVYFAGGAIAFASINDVACGNEVIIDDRDFPEFGPGSYDVEVFGFSLDGTTWEAVCSYEYDGGIATAPVCNVPVVF
ncbi:MAG: thrombospondin type 3 repeat-containing protein [Polyangiales bacterium]